jgi:chloramphenicol 3-O-phosphotransferase
MILLINGAFGVGKTTVAGVLRRHLPGSVVYNPEWAGSVLMRLPSWVRLRGAGTDDFQDIELWRRSVVAGTKLFRAVTRGPVIVPMAFSRRDYFDEIVAGLRGLDGSLKVYCLRAPMATILARLERRGEKIAGAEREWVVRKARACVEAHEDAYFGEPVDTEAASATEVAREIIERLGDREVVGRPTRPHA